ncbi:MAG: hypothetical protein ACFB9M_17890 [Myxococcota bacterium]
MTKAVLRSTLVTGAMMGIALAGSGCRPDAASPASEQAEERTGPTPHRSLISRPGSPPLPFREASAKELRAASARLQSWVREGASRADEPWALAHGLLAFGPELRASDGRLAADVIVADHLRKIDEPNGWAFPTRTKRGTPVEPHENLILKTLLDSGLSMDHRFEVDGQTVVLAELIRSAEQSFSEPPSAHAWARQAWTLDVFVMAQARANRDGSSESGSVALRQLSRRASEALLRLQAFLEGPASAGRPQDVEKRRQDIFAHTCGGLHFIQAVARAAALKGNEDLRPTLRGQLELLLFRFDAERAIYRRARASHPDYRLPIKVQELKFYGHLLETLGLAAEWGLIGPEDLAETRVRQVAADLVDTLVDLETVYARQKQLRKQAPQTYYDLIGDGCHAIRGMRLALRHFYES